MGKQFEVNNTDAEGRLTLADALVDKIVDLATLTGACIVALGTDIGGMFTPSDELAEELSVASTKAGEKFWRMPMEEGYWELMKSNIADFVNTGSCAVCGREASLGTLGYCRTCMERRDWRNRFCSLHIGRMGCQELISLGMWN